MIEASGCAAVQIQGEGHRAIEGRRPPAPASDRGVFHADRWPSEEVELPVYVPERDVTG
jgi:hypothetical protein